VCARARACVRACVK